MNTWETIQTHLEQAIKLAPDYTAPRYQLAVQLLEADLLPAARQAFVESISCALRRAHRLVEEATNSRQANDFFKAKRCMQLMMGENRLAAKACCRLGTIELAHGDTKMAREQFSSAIEFDPACAQAYFELGQLEQAAGRLVLAREYYYKTVEHEFTRGLAHLQLSLVITADDEFELAQNHYLIALDLEPGLEQTDLNIRFHNIR